MVFSMIYEEFQRQLGKAGLTVKEFSELVGMNRNSISNYAKRPTVPTHLAIISTLMGEMAERGIDFRQALAALAVSPKKPRGLGKRHRMANSSDTGVSSRGKGGKHE